MIIQWIDKGPSMGIVIGPHAEPRFLGILHWLVILFYSLRGLEVEIMDLKATIELRCNIKNWRVLNLD